VRGVRNNGNEYDTITGYPYMHKGEHSMRTWIKKSLRLTILMTALAGARAGMAYSPTSTDRFPLQADQSEDGQSPITPGIDTEDRAMSAVLGRRAPIAGLIGLTITLGAILMIRRRRRAADRGDRA
jgi:hypothetical protein